MTFCVFQRTALEIPAQRFISHLCINTCILKGRYSSRLASDSLTDRNVCKLYPKQSASSRHGTVDLYATNPTP